MVAPEDPYRALSLKLFRESSPEARCPYLRVDERNISCANCPSGTKPTDSASLQLWCLGGEERHRACIFHPKFRQLGGPSVNYQS